MKQAAHLTIDLSALADNYRLLQEKVGIHCKVGASVKANAYGLGIKPVVETLMTLKCPQYFVATLEEALILRQIDRQTPVATLNGLLKGYEEEYIAHNILPILNSPSDIARWRILAKEKEQILPAFLHIDTAMSRLGLSASELQAIIDDPSLIDGIGIIQVMSHFACSDEKDHPLNNEQAALFARYIKSFPKASYSLANSAGLFRNSDWHYDMVRPGYALYGGNPTPETKNPVKKVISLQARILQTRHCKKGESIGYGARHVFNKDTITATIGLGYADGFLRAGSNKAVVYWQGTPCPVIGRISMDLVTIDIGDITQKPHEGDKVEILGEHQTIDDLARTMGTIGYEILTSLGGRYHKEYI